MAHSFLTSRTRQRVTLTGYSSACPAGGAGRSLLVELARFGAFGLGGHANADDGVTIGHDDDRASGAYPLLPCPAPLSSIR